MLRNIIRHSFKYYGNKLDTDPLLTKSITSGVIAASGDALCQILSYNDMQSTRFDWIRTTRFAILGSFLVAPTMHTWYGVLMTRIPGKSIKAIGLRLFCDQALLAPLFTPTFISCLTILEHLSEKSVADGGNKQLAPHLEKRIRDSPEAIYMGWKIWVPSMAVMFSVVPSKYQVLYSNCVGFVWNGYLSWKTHEGEVITNQKYDD